MVVVVWDESSRTNIGAEQNRGNARSSSTTTTIVSFTMNREQGVKGQALEMLFVSKKNNSNEGNNIITDTQQRQ